jgi:hypothetical protein
MMFVPKNEKPTSHRFLACGLCEKLIFRYAMLSPAPDGANQQHMQQQHMQQQHMPATTSRRD